ncbi:hypothetical protein AYO22_07994 [Fonsecaea multimorphosa]|nr:hypothetical protein AYO22_07994 [Fonsecaea multimorphosa]
MVYPMHAISLGLVDWRKLSLLQSTLQCVVVPLGFPCGRKLLFPALPSAGRDDHHHAASKEVQSTDHHHLLAHYHASEENHHLHPQHDLEHNSFPDNQQQREYVHGSLRHVVEHQQGGWPDPCDPLFVYRKDSHNNGQ